MGMGASRDNHPIRWLWFLPLFTNASCIMPGPGPRCTRRSAQDFQELKLLLRKARREKPPTTTMGTLGPPFPFPRAGTAVMLFGGLLRVGSSSWGLFCAVMVRFPSLGSLLGEKQNPRKVQGPGASQRFAPDLPF